MAYRDRELEDAVYCGTLTKDIIPSPNEDDSSQFQSPGDVIQHGKRGGLLCRHRWRSDLITMPLA